MNGFRHGFQAALLLSALVGCSSVRLSQYDRLNPEPFNPYLKYLSSEPYWHFNFYPEPRWEYTYGLYSYPNPFSATIYSCHDKDKRHRHDRQRREPTPHQPKPGRTDKPVKPVKTPGPIKQPTAKPVKQPPSGQPPKHLEPKPPQTGAVKDEKSLKPLPQTAQDNRVPDKPILQSVNDFKKQPDSAAELEKPPGLRTDDMHENDSLRHSQTNNLPVDSRKASIDGQPKGLNDTSQQFSRNQSSPNQNDAEVTEINHGMFTGKDSTQIQKHTDIPNPGDNRVLEKASSKSKGSSSEVLLQNNRDRQNARVTHDNPIDRVSKPTENGTAIENSHLSVQKPLHEQSEPDRLERFHSSNRPAISDNFDRKTDLREKSPIREFDRRIIESVKEAPDSAPSRSQHETPLSRTIESAPIRHESPPDPPVRKFEPEPRPVMRSEPVSHGPAHEQPGNETHKRH